MIWQDVHILWLLLLIPVFLVLIYWRARKIKKLRSSFFSDNVFNKLRKGHWKFGNQLKVSLLFISVLFFIIAAAGPKVGTEVREVKRRGVDMLIALDLSASMNAEDVKPNRLDKAKYEINRLIERLKGDRVGLIIFTGEAYLQSPMTLDYSALRLFLNIADTDQMPSTTTDFASALEMAKKAFESIEESNATAAKVLLIISDGEDQGDDFSDPLKELTSDNIQIYTLGIGTSSGATIPLYEKDTGNLLGYKRDNTGKVVTTKLENGRLREIAEAGGGQYYEIQRGNDGIDSFLARVDELEKGEFSSQEYADFKNQYQWMAGLALFTLFIAFIIPTSKND